MTTATVKSHSFTTTKGNVVDVFNVKGVGSNGTFRGFGRAVATFAQVCGQRVDVTTGCAFEAWSAVAAAGF